MNETPDINGAGTPAKHRNRLRRRISYLVAVLLTAAIAGTGVYQSRLLPRRISDYVNTHYLR